MKMRLAVSEKLSRQLTYSNIIRLLEDPYPLTRESLIIGRRARGPDVKSFGTATSKKPIDTHFVLAIRSQREAGYARS